MPTFVLSDSSLNSYGFRVMTDGIDLTQFRKNPVMLFMHNRELMPIGKWTNIRVQGDQLLADPEFDEDDELAVKVKAKVDKGFLKMASAGLNAREYSTDPKYILPGQRRPTVVKSAIYEGSIVDIGSNDSALRLTDMQRGITLSANASEQDLDILLPTIKTEPQMKNLALQLGLKEDATEEEILAALKAKEDKHAKELAAAKKETEPEKPANAGDTAVNLVLKLGRAKGVVTDENEADYRVLAKADIAAVEKLIDKAPAKAEETPRIAELMEKLSKGGSAETTDADDRSKWTLQDWRKKDSNGLLRLKRDEPTKYEKLVADFAKGAKMLALVVLMAVGMLLPAATQAQTVIQWPFGAADIQDAATVAADSTCELTVSNRFTVATLPTVSVDSVFVTVTATAPTGSILYVKVPVSNTGGSVFKCSSGITCLPTTLATGGTHILEFIYDGTSYKLVANKQIQ